MIEFLRIAGMVIAIRRDDPDIGWEWPEASRRFLVPETAPDVELSVRTSPSIEPLEGEPLFDSGAVWRLFRVDDGFRIECHSPVFPSSPYKIATLDERFRRGTIVLSEAARHLCPLDYPLDEVLISHLLGQGRGVELHSCGVIDHQGRGHLFVGVSGAGKSTTARAWGSDAAAIVSDDRVIVREQNGVMRMHGTPWHGEAALSLPESAPLAGIYLLRQSPSNEVRPLMRTEAVARLFGCAFPPFHDPGAVAFTLSFLERLTETLPVRELCFTRDVPIATLIQSEAA